MGFVIVEKGGVKAGIEVRKEKGPFNLL